jgi:hypothetical protein
MYSSVPSARPALEKDVLGLEIAMHDAELVRLGERAAHLGQDLEHPLPLERLLLVEDLVQAASLEQLHRDVERAVGRAIEVVRRDRVRVAQLAQHVALAAKPRDEVLVLRHVGVQQLQRDLAPGRELQPAIHRAEAALADLRLDVKSVVERLPEVRILDLRARLRRRSRRRLNRLLRRRLLAHRLRSRGRPRCVAPRHRRRFRLQPKAAHAAEPSRRLQRRAARGAIHAIRIFAENCTVGTQQSRETLTARPHERARDHDDHGDDRGQHPHRPSHLDRRRR